MTLAKKPKPTPIMISPTKKEILKLSSSFFLFIWTKRLTAGLNTEQLPSSVDWQVMVCKVMKKNDSRGI